MIVKIFYCFILFLTEINSHGMLTIPISRNINDYCGHCLSAGGPLVVHANNGYKHGLCGNVGTDKNQNWNASTKKIIQPSILEQRP